MDRCKISWHQQATQAHALANQKEEITSLTMLFDIMAEGNHALAVELASRCSQRPAPSVQETGQTYSVFAAATLEAAEVDLPYIRLAN